jgi:hypothetical protein
VATFLYRIFRAQADWTFILPSELPTKELRHLPRKMPPQDYQTSQYVVPRGSSGKDFEEYILLWALMNMFDV